MHDLPASARPPTSRHRHPALVVGAILLPACGPTWAQPGPIDPDAAAALPAVVVRARTAPTSTEASGSYTTEATTAATGLSLSLRDTPQSISVVTRERITDQAMSSVGDALRNTTGVSLKPVDRGRNSVSVRGFDVNNFQLDGAPMATGNVGLETLNTAMFDRVEVVRGATGLLSGAGDPSASVNLVRKHADAKAFTGRLHAVVGSWSQRGGGVDLTTPLNADASVRLRVVADLAEQDAFIDLEHKRSSLLYAIVDADVSSHTRLSVGASDQRDRRSGVLWAGLPYWYADGTRTDWPRSKTTATKWNQWDTKEQTAFASVEHRLPESWKLRADLSHHRQLEDSKLLWMWGDPDRTTGGGLYGTPYHYIADPEQTHAGVSLTGPFEWLGRRHELHAGAMFSRLRDGWQNRDLIDDDGVLALPDFNQWDGSFPEPPMTDHYVASRGTTTQSAVYGVARLQLTDLLKAIVGARVSRWSRDEEAAAWTAEPYTIRHSGEVTPYAGLVYDLSPLVSAYASYSDIFKPQTSRDRTGAYLDPLEGRAYEAGVKGEFLDGGLNASLAVFRTVQQNFAVTDSGFVPGTNQPAMRPERATVKGYEFDLSGQLRPGWDIGMGWTQFSAKDPNGDPLAVDHARRMLKLFTKLNLQGAWQGLALGAGVTWEGGRPATAANPATSAVEKVGQPSFALVDLMARYEFDRHLELQLNVFNALDKSYRSGSYWWGAPYTYGEPRRLQATLAYRF